MADMKKMEPIEIFCRDVSNYIPNSMLNVPLNAAATVLITGKTYLHGWSQQQSDSGGGSGTVDHENDDDDDKK